MKYSFDDVDQNFNMAAKTWHLNTGPYGENIDFLCVDQEFKMVATTWRFNTGPYEEFSF